MGPNHEKIEVGNLMIISLSKKSYHGYGHIGSEFQESVGNGWDPM